MGMLQHIYLINIAWLTILFLESIYYMMSQFQMHVGYPVCILSTLHLYHMLDIVILSMVFNVVGGCVGNM